MTVGTILVGGTADAGLVVAKKEALGLAVLVCCAFGGNTSSAFAERAIGTVGVLGAGCALSRFANLAVRAIGGLLTTCGRFAFSLIAACFVAAVFVLLTRCTCFVQTDLSIRAVCVRLACVGVDTKAFFACFSVLTIG